MDSPLRGLERYEGAPVKEIRSATRRAFVNLIDLAINEAVDFVILAGDIYDGDLLDYQSGLFFANQMSRLREFEIRVYLVRGNHDAESEITKTIRLPDNVHQFSATPDTVIDHNFKVAVHGWSYPTRAITEDMSVKYPAPITGLYNIGVLHTALDGREGHDTYAPCNVSYLRNKGYDYWALGHVHNREIVVENPPIVFPGNLQGRNSREIGSKGCMLVSVIDGKTSLEFRALDVLQWQVINLDLGQADSLDAAIDITLQELHKEVLSNPQFYALRFNFSGATSIHQELQHNKELFINNLRAAISDLSSNTVWIEKVIISTKAAGDLLALFEEYPTLKQFLEILKDLSVEAELTEDVLAELGSLFNFLPPEAMARDGLNPNDPQFLGEIIAQARKLIVDEMVVR